MPPRYFSLSAFALLLLVSISCQQTPSDSVVNNYYTSDPYADPSVKFNVLSTNPPNGAVGPFSSLDPTVSTSNAHIIVQLNKYVDATDIPADAITLRADGKIIPIGVTYPSGSGTTQRSILNLLLGRRYLNGRTYTLTIDTTLFDVHGNRLSAPFTTSFIPEPNFRPVYVSPADRTLDDMSYFSISPNNPSVISLDFNGKVDSSIFSKLTIVPAVGGKWGVTQNYYNGVDTTTVQYRLLQPLAFNKQYTVTIGAGAADAEHHSVKAPYSFSFQTASFGVQSAMASYSTAPGGFSAPYNVTFSFNGPLDTSTVRSALTVTPAVPFTLYFSSNFSSVQYHVVSLTFPLQYFQPGTTYTVSCAPTVKTKAGDVMSKPYQYTVVTGM